KSAAGPGHVEFIGAQKEQHVAVAKHAGDILAALAGNEADIQPADPSRGRVQHRKAVPFRRDGAHGQGKLRSLAQYGLAILTQERTLPYDNERLCCSLKALEELAVAFCQVLQRLRTSAKLLVFVAQVSNLADDADGQRPHTIALADASVENRRLEARIGANNQDRVSLFDAFDRCIEYIAAAPKRRVERRPVLPAVEIRRTERLHQKLEGVHFLDRSEIAGNGANPLRRALVDSLLDGCKGFVPGGGRQLAILADIR